MDKPIVFGVGMPLTGNDTLAEALKARGYLVREGGDWNESAAKAFLTLGDERILHDCTWGGHNAWVGWPVVAYKQLLRVHPTALFVVTITNPDKWLKRWEEFEAAERDEPLADGSSQSLFVEHLFGSVRPSRGHAVNTYGRQTDAITAYLTYHKANVVVLDMEGRRTERRLAKLFGPVGEPEEE